MVRRILARGMTAAIATMLVPGTAWSEPAVDASQPEGPPPPEMILPLGSTPLRMIAPDRSELLGEWATRRDKRTAPGTHPVGAVLGTFVLVLLAVSERVTSRRPRRRAQGRVSTLGARSPPLLPT